MIRSSVGILALPFRPLYSNMSRLFLFLLVTTNNQFLTMNGRRCMDTARIMMKMSEANAYLNVRVNDDEV